MPIRRSAALTALALSATSVLALGASPSSATTTLRLDPSNTVFSGATQIRNNRADPAVFSTSLGTITCPETDFEFDVSRHTSATSISGSLTTFTLTACTDTIAPVNITSCHLHQPTTAPGVTITGGAGGGTIVLSNTVWRCNIQNSPPPGFACYYSASTANGSYSNSLNSLTFPTVTTSTVQPTSDALASGLCGSASTLGFSLTHIVQSTTNKTLTVTT